MRYWPNNRDSDWPADLPPISDEREAFKALFVSLGYEECDATDNEAGYERVALYGYDDGELSHAARQLETGRWASKLGLGSTEDIEHDSLEDLYGDGQRIEGYGSVVLVMRRQRAAP